MAYRRERQAGLLHEPARQGTGILKVAKKLGVGHSTVARTKASLS